VAGTNPFRVEGVIVSVRESGIFLLELPNRHQLLGYVVRREREKATHLRVGDRVEVEVSPYDLSKGRVRLKKEEEQ
jgi:translation initiation factor IF-1